MECIRGFSYMPTVPLKVEEMDMQYIEGQELERTWKATRRQRAREQEQKIWDEFVKEKNSVVSALEEDPYQFLHDLPENCLKELMDTELQKMKKEVEQEASEQPKQGEGDSRQPEQPEQVAFEEDKECAMFHIYDDENDENDNHENNDDSEPEDDAANDVPQSPSTVRENIDISPKISEPTDDKNKSTEDVRNLVESSINLSRIRDLRVKISNQLQDIKTTIENQDVGMMEQSTLFRAARRAAEFSGRYNRIYIYQIQRVMHDIKRSTKHVLPFAQHTQFQAQLLRILSLHQTMLQAVQVFQKSLEQTWCLRESAAALHNTLCMFRAASALCVGIPAPRDFAAAADLYKDELLVTCDKIETTLSEYSDRISHFFETENSSRKSKSIGKRPNTLASTTASKSNMDSRLSMYSLETFRQYNGKTIKDAQSSSGTSKVQGSSQTPQESHPQSHEKAHKKKQPGQRSRRPLMRAPCAPERARRGLSARDTEITTMVEGVEACASSHISPVGSIPGTAGKRNKKPFNRKAQSGTDRPQNPSPKAKLRRKMKPSLMLKALSDSHSSKISVPRLLATTEEHETQTDRGGKVRHSMVSVRTPKLVTKGDCNPDVAEDCLSKEATVFLGAKESKLSPMHSGQKRDRIDKRDLSNDESLSAKDLATDCGLSALREEKEGSRIECQRKDGCIDSCPKYDGIDKNLSNTPARCEVTRLLKHLCSGDTLPCSGERGTAKNAQLLCINGGSPRQPSTPQLLRILEETIQKKAPKSMFPKPAPVPDPDRFRLVFNISQKTTSELFQYRTAFVQHMLASPMYANSAVGKPWEMIGNVSDKIIDEALAKCAKEMQIHDVIQELYACESK